jgi:hypothetical protein
MDTDTTTDRRLPRRARILIALVVAAGAGCLAARLPEALGWGRGDLLACLALAAATAVAEQFPIRLPHGSDTETFSLTDAVWAAGLVLARPGVLTIAAALGVAAGQALRRLPPVKVGFNVGQFAVSLTVAEAVAAALGHTDAPALVAAGVGMAAFFLVNSSVLAELLAVLQGAGFLSAWLPPAFLNVVHWAGNLAIGLLGAWAWHRHPWAVPPLVLPLALSYVGYRAWIREFLRRPSRPPAPAAR